MSRRRGFELCEIRVTILNINWKEARASVMMSSGKKETSEAGFILALLDGVGFGVDVKGWR